MTDSIPRAPRGLGSAGKALWKAVLTDYELDEHENSILTQACRVADACDKLQGILDAEGVMSESSQGSRVHPALVELRQQGIALARLMTALRIPAGEQTTGAGRSQSRPGVRGIYAVGGAS